MVFNENDTLILVLVIGIVWLGMLTFLVFRMIRHYNRLMTGVTKTGLRSILESMIGREEDLKKRQKELEEAIDRIDKEGMVHFQRLGIVRFNPFSDTGGSQSFSMAILDREDNGIVITSLYARTGNRWYIKEIQGGKGKELVLSKEEEAAIKKARV
ncbi:DUF4446 family protein [Candidatus Gottesmanbacteria bacterium]|nr:DUF4446 family protein [Candidatus Gottesmanbacteria bacterium]